MKKGQQLFLGLLPLSLTLNAVNPGALSVVFCTLWTLSKVAVLQAQKLVIKGS